VASVITEELVRRGHDVTLYATADSVTSARLRSIVPTPLLEEGGRALEHKVYGYLHAALPFEDADQFDVIHNHYDGYPLVFSRLVETPVVTTVHGFSSPQISEIYRRYDNVHYVSITDADRRHCPEMNWIATVHHGVDFAELPFGAEPDEYVCFLGRIHPFKGVDVAIEAAQRAGVVLKIAGHIDENDPRVLTYWRDEIEPRIDGERVVWVGEVGPTARSELLRGARACLCPIQWDEPFGLVFVESMASGTPVVAFGRGSAPELIEDGVSGALVPPDDVDGFAAAIETAAGLDRAAVRRYAEANFTITKMVDGYVAVYERITGPA
jgi:glycosyltransferase involved in cell wall biosynthesis